VTVSTHDGKVYEDSTAYWLDQPIEQDGAEDKLDYTNKHNTPLEPDEQKEYDKKFSPRDSYDYDMQGWFKANKDQPVHEGGEHYPDTYKKPNHPTFSDESQYHDNVEYKGGHWGDDASFTPGETNIQMHGKEKLQDYFNRNEPGLKLNEPQASNKQLYFVRHGDTELNDECRQRGWSPVSLNQDGREQAKKAADSVKDVGITHIVASDLPRAKQTANIIGNKLGITPEFHPGLRTWDLGDFTGKKDSEVGDQIKSYTQEKADERIPGSSESFNEFKDRILGTTSEIVNSHPEDHKVLMVSHNSPERVLNAWTEAGQPQHG
jgi:broad specificity phosphatase PhoE